MNYSKIVTTKRTSAIFLAIVLVTGTIAMSFSFSSSFMIYAQAQQYYYYNEMDNNNYYQKSYGYNNYKSQYPSYGKDNYKSTKDSSNVDLNKIKCNNINVNINGQGGNNGNATNGDSINGNETKSHGSKKFNKDDFAFVCINNNNNIVVGGGNQTTQPVPEPEPTTLATLTVNKEIFGCTNFPPGFEMDCSQMTNTDMAWLPCTDPLISNSAACRELTANLFDIEVLDDQDTPIQQFVGSAQGTTIENLQPGTYTVNEIKYPTNINQLGESLNDQTTCGNLGFDDGGTLLKTTPTQELSYIICIEYEDEQDNDCSTLTLAAGEDKTCTVKNYIRSVSVPF